MNAYDRLRRKAKDYHDEIRASATMEYKERLKAIDILEIMVTGCKPKPRQAWRWNYGVFAAAVEAAVKRLGNPFNTQQVIRELESLSYGVEEGANQRSVAPALRRMLVTGKLRLVERGRGRRPHTYALITATEGSDG